GAYAAASAPKRRSSGPRKATDARTARLESRSRRTSKGRPGLMREALMRSVPTSMAKSAARDATPSATVMRNKRRVMFGVRLGFAACVGEVCTGCSAYSLTDLRLFPPRIHTSLGRQCRLQIVVQAVRRPPVYICRLRQRPPHLQNQFARLLSH